MRTTHGLNITMEGRVARVEIDRPERLNALSLGLRSDIVEAFDRFSRDDEVWAVLLTASGTRAFSAGVDLKEINELEAGASNERMLAEPMGGRDRNPFEVVWECAKPVIAALNGVAVGGGLELALACDMRVAVAGARIGLPESKRGMGANFGSALLPRLIPRGVAYEMLYTGELMSVEDAAHWGLVNHVLDADGFAESAMEIAQQIAGNAPLTVRRYKQLISRGSELPLPAALRLGVGPDPYRSEDRREGVAAFVEKREPRWQAR